MIAPSTTAPPLPCRPEVAAPTAAPVTAPTAAPAPVTRGSTIMVVVPRTGVMPGSVPVWDLAHW